MRAKCPKCVEDCLGGVICSDLTPPLVPPCWVVVNPNPQTEGVTVDEAGRRRLDMLSLWEFIASITIEGDTIQDQATIDSASAAILDVAEAVAAAVGGDIEVIVAGVLTAFEVLTVELSPDPYEWATIIPDVTGYQLVGKGYCTSSLGEYYGGIQYQASSVKDCVDKCKASVCFAENDWTMAAVEYRTDSGKCWCLINDVYEDGDSCSDPDAGFAAIDYGPGTGQPWFSGPEGQANFLCFRFI